MNEIRIALNDAAVRAAFAAAPAVMERNIDRYLSRAAQEVAREEKRIAPKAFSTLVDSIRVELVNRLHYVVVPGVAYAQSVEDGRMPGRQPGTGNGLMEWVKQKTGLTGNDLDRRTYVIARAIGRKGIKPQPFAAPTAEKMEPRVFELAQQGVDAGLKEAFPT